jgi:Peptidase propeptide and YPEB domain
MKKRTIWISSAAAGAALVLGGTAIAFATTDGFAPGGEPPETSDDGGHLTGSDLDAASAAALEATGPGTVLEAEVGDDGRSAYEVEVRLDRGGTVEVKLDASFDVIDVTGEDDGGAGDDGSSDDD